MKHKSIFTIFAALTMVLGFAMTGLGQNADMTGKAFVVDAIGVSVTQSLNFGSILSPSGSDTLTKSVSLNNDVGGTATTVAGVTPVHGIFKIVKGENTALSVKYTALAPTLTGDVGGSMAMSGYISTCNTDDANGNTGVLVSCVVGTSTSITTLNASPTIYVHLAATVSALPLQVAGTYTGTITLEAEYN